MTFFGFLIVMSCVAAFIWGGHIIFRDIIYPLYEETYLQKKYERDLLNKVRWIAIKSFENRDNELYEYIMREQYELNVETEFCIDFSNEKEKDFICRILEIHKQKDNESFFRGSLKKDKVFYRLNNLEYYMFSLYNFLRENELCGEFDKIILYKFDHQDELYRTYKFTDFGILYQKLHYIVALFCVNNEKIKPLFNSPTNTINNIKKNLESEELKLWS